MLIYYRMYNHTLNCFSFDDIIDVFIWYIVLYYEYLDFCVWLFSVEIVNLKKLQKSISEMKWNEMKWKLWRCIF